jgi:D-sedoheptulose 7-phosphate isomerase
MGDYAAYIGSALRHGARLRLSMADASRVSAVARACEMLVASLRSGGKVLLFGNGGSAADAQHVAAELVGRLTVDRPALAAIALTVDSSALTSIANDYGYAQVFERQLRALGKPGDVAIAITTSGNSESVRRAVSAAKELGIATIGFTGAKGTAFAAACDVGIVVPSTDTARIQEIHIAVGHVLCAVAEAELCGVALPAQRSPGASKLVTLEAMLATRGELRAQGRVVVWTNGCFDILHAGHVESLRAARSFGDVLVVGVNDDDYVRRTKGEGRPIHALEQRVTLLSALEMVDFVLPFSESTPEPVLRKLQPDVHCKGADYAPPNGAPIPEAETVRAYGGRIEFLPLVDGLSTTSIARRLSG